MIKETEIFSKYPVSKLNIILVPERSYMRRRAFEEEDGQGIQEFSFWLIGLEERTSGELTDV